MAKPQIKSNPRAIQIFEDLEEYLAFCKEYGYYFDEKDLYNAKSLGYKQFLRANAGKSFRDIWLEDQVE